MRVKYLAQEHNTMTRPGLEPGPLDPESSALTTGHRVSYVRPALSAGNHAYARSPHSRCTKFFGVNLIHLVSMKIRQTITVIRSFSILNSSVFFIFLSANWCQHWFEFFPNPPVNILGMVENILVHHDKRLMQHFVNCNVTSQVRSVCLDMRCFAHIQLQYGQ